MKHTNILYLFALVSLVFSLGCERSSSNKSRITLQLPDEMSSYSSGNLKHLALQISAHDINPPLRIILDSESDSKSLSPTMEVEIPSGDNRLVQLVAAYADPGSDSPTIFYGDVTQALKKSTEIIDLPVSKLSGSSASTMARVTGRFLTDSNFGPTGTVRMVYRPSGKPSMPVDSKPILNGWFEVSTFNDIPMDYEVTASNGSTTTLGTQWTNSSFLPANHLVRITSPAGYERIEASAGYAYQARDAQLDVFGFFAADPSLLSDKQICIQATTPLNGGTYHLERSLVSADILTARPLKFFATGATATFSNSYVTMAGGKERSTCGTLDPVDEYKKYLLFASQMGLNQNLYQDFSQLFGLNDGFAATTFMDIGSLIPNRWTFTSQYSPALGYHFSAKVLPGLESTIDELRIYKINNYNYGYAKDNRCDRLDSNFWSFTKSLTPTFSGNNLILKPSDIPPISTSYGICMMSKGAPVGRILDIFNVGGTPTPINRIIAAYPHNKPPHVEECTRLSVSLVSTTAGNSDPIYNPHSLITATLNATLVGPPTDPSAILYSTADCSGTPQSSLPITLNKNELYTSIFFKAPTAQSITLSYSGISPTLTTDPLPLNITAEDTTIDHIDLEPHSNLQAEPSVAELNIPMNACFPYKVVVRNSINDTAVVPSGSLSFGWKDLDGNVISTPTGVNLYSSCNASTPITSLSFSGQNSRSFVIKTSSPLVKDVQLYLTGFADKIVGMNLSPLANQLAFQYGSAPNHLSLQTSTCTHVTLVAQNANGTAKTVARDLNVSFGGGNDIAFYEDSSCSTEMGSTTINQGSSSQSLYVKALKAGAHSLSAFSARVPTVAFLNISATAKTMTIPGAPTTVSQGSNYVVTIDGGSAPFSIDSTMNLSSYNVSKYGGYYKVDFTVDAAATGTISFRVLSSAGVAPVTTTINVSPP